MKPANEITAIWARNVTIIKAAATRPTWENCFLCLFPSALASSSNCIAMRSSSCIICCVIFSL